jgi:23S rRNA-/tRNA-specific pseudouridylate synthase
VNDELYRLDILLVKKFNISRNYAENLIKLGKIFVNEILVKNKHKKYKYECIITIQMTETTSPKLEYMAVTDDYIIVNKPAGISCCRCSTTPKHEHVLNELVSKDYSLSGSLIPEEFGLPHRIDKDTEGLLLMSRTKEFYNFALNGFKNGLIKKTYLCLSNIKKKEFKEQDIIYVNLLYGNDKVLVRKNGIPSETSYEVLSTYHKYKVIKVFPITGRKHQIRTVLNYLGAPIVGDTLYKGQAFSKLCLFASELAFNYKNQDLHFSKLTEQKHKINNLLMHLHF